MLISTGRWSEPARSGSTSTLKMFDGFAVERRHAFETAIGGLPIGCKYLTDLRYVQTTGFYSIAQLFPQKFLLKRRLTARDQECFD